MDFEISSIVRNHMKLFHLVGFCTISLDTRHNWKKIEKILLTWSVISVITFTALTVGILLHQSNLRSFGDKFGELNYISKLTCVAVAYQVSIIESLLSRKHDRCFWVKYSNLQKEKSQKYREKSSDRYRYFLWSFYGYLGIKLLFEITLGVAECQHRQLLVNWLIYIPSTVVTALKTMQIILYIELIRAEVKDLNLRLISLRRRCKRLRGAALEAEFKQIKQLMWTYQIIHEMMEHFKAACGWSMAINFTKSYIVILADFFWTFSLMYSEDEHVEYLVLIPAIVEMVLPLVISRNCMRLIEYFSLQILHQKLEINAVGLFVFNCKLSRKVLGSIAVNMLFFIQFLPKFKRKDKDVV